MTWTVPCLPGVLKAVGSNSGDVVCWDELVTAGRARAIEMMPEHPAVWADGRDLCHIEVNVVDANGIPVPDSSSLIQFDISAQGKIVGVDNANLWSTESYKAIHRKAFHGRCIVIVQATGRPGPIELTATALGLDPAELTIDVAK
jgi:beta-galactosidase